MVYAEHDVFLAPEDENQKIWRFMDVPKFASLLIERSLFFCCLDKLGDPFEGSLTKASLLYHRAAYGGLVDALAEKYEPLRSTSLVNCWHMNDHESAAMWGLYAPTGAGVAVQSTFAKLRLSLDRIPDQPVFITGDVIHIGKISHLDFDSNDIKDMIPLNNLLNLLMTKQKSYEHERELRAMLPLADQVAGCGRLIPVDLDTLVENIFVSPTAPERLRSAVEHIAKAYGLEREVQHSRLDRSSMFY